MIKLKHLYYLHLSARCRKHFLARVYRVTEAGQEFTRSGRRNIAWDGPARGGYLAASQSASCQRNVFKKKREMLMGGQPQYA